MVIHPHALTQQGGPEPYGSILFCRQVSRLTLDVPDLASVVEEIVRSRRNGQAKCSPTRGSRPPGRGSRRPCGRRLAVRSEVWYMAADYRDQKAAACGRASPAPAVLSRPHVSDYARESNIGADKETQAVRSSLCPGALWYHALLC